MHHHPVGGAPPTSPAATEPMDDQLRRTVIAWSLVRAAQDEPCVLWDIDMQVGVDQPWGIELDRVREIQAAVAEIVPRVRN